ncbi:DNA translocase FtsK [Patescibacteria group bacterium]|nr:DNA translocase FtsK [Patescibacteria group bacterium]MDL1953244.1 DNA translocase FtsK [Candidatus Uhrbacteria bacterium UHB]RIL00947.1 MAG: cell division protein FtsK [Candidatus Uhrbacteria bacterium]
MARRRRRRFRKLDFSLDPETRRGIFTVFLFLCAFLILLSIFGLAGSIGNAVDAGVSQVFGWDKLFVPFFLIAWGYHLIDPEKLPMNASNFVGFALFFVGLNGFMHAVSFPSVTVLDDAALRGAAGKLGQLLAEPALTLLGFAGTITLFLAIFVTSLLLIFNTSLQAIIDVFTAVWRGCVWLLKLLARPFVWLFRKKSASPDTYEEETGEDGEEEVPDEEAEEEEEEDEIEENESAPDGTRRTSVVPKKTKPKRRRAMIEVPLDLLTKRDDRPTSGDLEHNKEVIRKTLAQFGIKVEMGDVAVGPTVTQFTFKPAEGVKLTRITALHNDLALALAAHPIRIEAPIPGKSLVGIEVPNKSVAMVGLREMLESAAYQDKQRKMSIPFSLGKDVSGTPCVADLAKMPHMLVAGATGSGKSVCMNILIMSLLYNHGPDDLKFILVDPKRVEFPVYNGIPHLITPVITKVEDTVNALKWTLREMDRRFDILSSFGARDLASYNQRSKDKLPYLVFIIDELADLMVTSGAEVEGPIVRLAQMARAVGVHLVLATQRPSVDVLTGLIKANVPARMAFSVASSTDSRTILDQVGAEKLLGRGDMLYQTAEMSAPKRVQGAFVGDDEVRRVVEFLKSKYGPADYDAEVIERKRGALVLGSGSSDDGDADPLLESAMEEIVRAGKASASLLQRRLKVGYARAARILDLLEQSGYIGPADGAKPRDILKADFSSQTEEVFSDDEGSDDMSSSAGEDDEGDEDGDMSDETLSGEEDMARDTSDADDGDDEENEEDERRV